MRLLDEWDVPPTPAEGEGDSPSDQSEEDKPTALESLEQQYEDHELTRALSSLRFFHAMKHEGGVEETSATVDHLLRQSAQYFSLHRAPVSRPVYPHTTDRDISDPKAPAAPTPMLAPPPPPRYASHSGGANSFPPSATGPSTGGSGPTEGQFPHATWSPATRSTDGAAEGEQQGETTPMPPLLLQVRAVHEVASEMNKESLKAACADVLLDPRDGIWQQMLRAARPSGTSSAARRPSSHQKSKGMMRMGPRPLPEALDRMIPGNRPHPASSLTAHVSHSTDAPPASPQPSGGAGEGGEEGDSAAHPSSHASRSWGSTEETGPAPVCVDCHRLRLQVQAMRLEHRSELKHMRKALREAYQALEAHERRKEEGGGGGGGGGVEEERREERRVEPKTRPAEAEVEAGEKEGRSEGSSAPETSTDSDVIDESGRPVSAAVLRHEVQRLKRRLKDERALWSQLLAENSDSFRRREEQFMNAMRQLRVAAGRG